MREADVEALSAALGWPVRSLQHRWNEKEAGLREALVAEVDGGPVGTVSFNEKPEFAGLLHLFAFDVAETSRNRGIGSQLVTAIESAAKDLALSGVYLEVNVENSGAIRLYERLGYRLEGEPFINRWIAQDGTAREVSELSRRMVKRFEGPIRL
jgi:ribosomal protein S18 acetylase RimI-like enzyme